MDTTSSGNAYDSEHMSIDILEDICDSSQSCLSINRRDARYKICDHIKVGQTEWKGALLSTQYMVKGLHKLFKAVVNDILQDLPILGKSVSEVSYFIPEPMNFAQVTRLSEDIK